MRLQIITLYCVWDAYLTHSAHTDDPQAKMSTAEVMTTALVAAWFFAGNLRNACAFLQEAGHNPARLTQSRFNRRLPPVTPARWQGVLSLLAHAYPDDTFAVDSCPIAVCHRKRGYRCRLYKDENKAY